MSVRSGRALAQERLDATRAKLQALGAWVSAEEAERVGRLIEDQARVLEGHPQSAVVALIGASGAGKSTLFNSLSGRELVETGTMRPTSRTATVLRPTAATIDTAQLGPRVVLLEGTSSLGQEIVLVDTPDYNSAELEHAVRAREVAEVADLLIVVAHRQSIVELEGLGFLGEYSRRRGVLFVLGHADRLPPQAVHDLREQFRETAEVHLGLCTRGLHALDLRGPIEGEAWAGLLRDIEQEVGRAGLESLREANALGALEEAEELLSQVHGRYAQRAREREELAGAVVPDLVDFISGELEEDLQSESEAWIGLRLEQQGRSLGGLTGTLLASPLSQLILRGAALLLVRRAPLVGAAAAAGSVGGQRLARAGRARRWRDLEPLLPSAERVHSGWEGATGALRLTGVSVDTLAASQGSLSVLSGTARDWAADQEGGRPAGGWAIRGLMGLLPLLLALRALLLAGGGMLGGGGFGVDGLVDTLVLAGAWGLAVRGAVRWSWRRAALRSLPVLAERIRQDLAEQAQEVIDRVLAEDRACALRLRGLDAGAGL